MRAHSYMGFNILFNILRLISGLSHLFKGNPESKLTMIMSALKDISKENDPARILSRLQQDEKFRAKAATKIANLCVRQEQMLARDMVNARKRDIKIQKQKKRNYRADAMVMFAGTGLIISLILLVYFRNRLTTDLILIFTSIIGFFTSIMTDASLFEFGNNGIRSGFRKHSNDDR